MYSEKNLSQCQNSHRISLNDWPKSSLAVRGGLLENDCLSQGRVSEKTKFVLFARKNLVRTSQRTYTHPP
jgi:hypothetical protein